MREARELDKLHVVYRLPAMKQVLVRKDIIYKTVEGKDLKLDIYYPPNMPPATCRSAVILVHGGAQEAQVEHIREDLQYVSWCRLIAASGLIAVLFQHRSDDNYRRITSVGRDVSDLFAFVQQQGTALGIDPRALGIWCCSSGALYGLSAALRGTQAYIRCLVAYYGGMTLLNHKYFHFSPEEEEIVRVYSPDYLLSCADAAKVAPLFIARAGQDRPFLNEILDEFVMLACRRNVPLTLMNHPTGVHGFDILNNDARTHEIIKATLAFLATHLAP
ncbi:alpha/beta hydrolase [Ktedonosporobacter rubrisoli]|uniref:Alpha/beta hydrolase n=1 Tax=Ktedonosporobacter rubrisoli TaxID=2509675 RepID=A0A4P6JIH3_KTERU|nr:alpha/beta hydrolase [Ktedonosporobacter rubrisoli]QBD74859.1 alpha/beta hydrolase [Ktedonosporobacter rubrisoli]